MEGKRERCMLNIGCIDVETETILVNFGCVDVKREKVHREDGMYRCR